MFDLSAEEARLLLNIALMATGANRFQSAAKLFAALERYRPEASSVAVGKAIALISALQFAACVEYIDREGLVKFPDNAMLLAFKGMALIRMDRPDAARPVLEQAAGGRDAEAAQLARGLLDDL